jgi:UrcA family protein
MNTYAKTDSRVFGIGSFIMVAASILLLAQGASAVAEDSEVSMAVVKFQDLDVNTPAGTEALYWRIHRAANRVCGVEEGSLLPVWPRKRCALEAEARAVGQLNIARLTAFYQAKTGKLPTTQISMAK